MRPIREYAQSINLKTNFKILTQTLIDSFRVKGVEPYKDAGTELDFNGVALVFF